MLGEFIFLESVTVAAQQAMATTREINGLFEKDEQLTQTLGRARLLCMKIFAEIKTLPLISTAQISRILGVSICRQHVIPLTT